MSLPHSSFTKTCWEKWETLSLKAGACGRMAVELAGKLYRGLSLGVRSEGWSFAVQLRALLLQGRPSGDHLDVTAGELMLQPVVLEALMQWRKAHTGWVTQTLCAEA